MEACQEINVPRRSEDRPVCGRIDLDRRRLICGRWIDRDIDRVGISNVALFIGSLGPQAELSRRRIGPGEAKRCVMFSTGVDTAPDNVAPLVFEHPLLIMWRVPVGVMDA